MATKFCLTVLFLFGCVRISLQYDFFVLAQQWPPSLCNVGRQCKQPIKEDFTIYGMWPNLFSGARLEFCTRTPFDRRQIAAIRNLLISDWPNVYDPSKSDGFWSYQWRKHGTCSENRYQLSAYFRLHFIRNRFPLNRILAAANIVPGGAGTYSAAFIRSTIQAQTNTVVKTVCNGNATNPRAQLQEIRICLDSAGTGFINCPATIRNSCDQFVSFPA